MPDQPGGRRTAHRGARERKPGSLRSNEGGQRHPLLDQMRNAPSGIDRHFWRPVVYVAIALAAIFALLSAVEASG